MRVCILTHTFPRDKNDFAAPFMDGVASGLQEAGNEVFVLTPFTPGFKRTNKDQKYKILTYKYIYPDSLHKLGYSQTLANDMELKPIVWLLSPFMYFFCFLALTRLVKKENIDIVNAHWILPNGFIATLSSFFTGVPVVSTLPGSDVYMAEKNFLFTLLARFATKFSAHITSNSPQLLEDLARINTTEKREQNKLKKKFSPLIYGVDPNRFRPDKSYRFQVRKELGIPKSDLVVLSVGRLVAKKGFKYLVMAAPKILKRYKNVSFVIIGEGDNRRKLENLAKRLGVLEKFRLPGWVDYYKLKNYYNLADVFILPSVRDEGGNLDDQSVSVIEAMATGKPVVTTDFPGYRLVVKHGQNGFLVGQKDARAIAISLLKLIKDKNLRLRMGRFGRRLVLKYFSWPVIGKAYTNLFTEIIQTDKLVYSKRFPEIFNEKQRLQTARKIISVLRSEVDTENLSVLDVGCSSGTITYYSSNFFKMAVGVDVDEDAIKLAKKRYKKKNLKFYLIGSEKMPFKDSSFDVVVCNQVYEFVNDQEMLVSEIFRILKPGGTCFLGARNKFSILEGQTKIPLLHFLPIGIIEKVRKIFNINYYPAKYLTSWQLKKLFRKFAIYDKTVQILRNPKDYDFRNLERFRSIMRLIPLEILYPFIPNYIWILRKR